MADVVARVGGSDALPQEDDQDLVEAVRLGDDHAFERLYSRYHRRIAAYVRGMIKDHSRAEDVTQEVFISALRRLRSSDQEIALKPWLYEIARNACIDQYRRTQRAPEVLLDGESAESERLVAFGPTPDVAVDTKQTLDHLRHAFHGLSDVQHEILVMRELEGRSYREIGERMNLTRPAVESALFRARRRLMEEYEDLSSGSRCMRVQRAINSACTGTAGVRERWRIASHVSHCHVCLRHARLCGLGPEFTSPTLPARVAAVLPLPAFLRRALVARSAARVAPVSSDHVSRMFGWASAFSSTTDPLSAWITAGAAAATVALAIGGASVMGSGSSHHPRAAAPASYRSASGPAAPPAHHAASGASLLGGHGARQPGRQSHARYTPHASASTPAVARSHSPTAPTSGHTTRSSGASSPLAPTVPGTPSTSDITQQTDGAQRTVDNAATTVNKLASGVTSPTTQSTPQAVSNVTSTVTQAVSSATQAVGGTVSSVTSSTSTTSSTTLPSLP